MLSLSDLEAVVARGVRVGITDLAPFPRERDRIKARVAHGLNGGLGFTYRAPDVSAAPATSFPWAQSIVVVAVPYLHDGDAEPESGGRTIARFADGDRYAAVRDALTAITDVVSSEGFRGEMVFDDDRLIDRAVAVRAGIAWNGKSTMAITPLHGPWILLGSVVTDAPLTPTPSMVRGCGSCAACIPACPTDAIIEPGILDASRCLAAVLQRPGAIPGELRVAVGPRIYGCDDCLTACPPGDHALAGTGNPKGMVTAKEILSMADVDIDRRYAHWYVPKRNMRFVRRNALVALGNTGTVSDLGLLGGYLGHPDPLLRRHAAWATGRIGGAEASDVLASALSGEAEPEVIDEILAALTITSSGPVYAESSNEPRFGSTELE